MTEGPLADLLVLDLTRALAGPHAAMMLGDLGARVIKIESPVGRRHPRLGAAVRGPGRRARVDVLPLGQPQQGVAGPRPQDRRRPRRAGPAGGAGRRADGELPARRARPAGLPDRAAARAQPAAGGPLDHRLRPRRPRGVAAGLRPDRPGRGRADVVHRHRAADQGGRPDRRPAAPACTARSASWPRCTSGRGPAEDGSYAPPCWPGWSASTPSRAPAGRSPARCRGCAGDHHPSIAPYGLFATATAPIQIACGSEGLWRTLCGGVGLGRRRAVRHQPDAGRPPRRADRPDRGALRDRRPSTGWGCSRRPASRPARCAPSTTSTRGSRRCLRACCSVDHATLGTVTLPGLADPLRRQPVSRRTLRAPPPPDARPARRVDPGVAGLLAQESVASRT